MRPTALLFLSLAAVSVVGCGGDSVPSKEPVLSQDENEVALSASSLGRSELSAVLSTTQRSVDVLNKLLLANDFADPSFDSLGTSVSYMGDPEDPISTGSIQHSGSISSLGREYVVAVGVKNTQVRGRPARAETGFIFSKDGTLLMAAGGETVGLSGTVAEILTFGSKDTWFLKVSLGDAAQAMPVRSKIYCISKGLSSGRPAVDFKHYLNDLSFPFAYASKFRSNKSGSARLTFRGKGSIGSNLERCVDKDGNVVPPTLSWDSEVRMFAGVPACFVDETPVFQVITETSFQFRNSNTK